MPAARFRTDRAHGSGSSPSDGRAVPSRKLASTTLAAPRKCASRASAGCSYSSAGAPCWTIRPSRRTATVSASDSASSWSWVTSTVVTPWLAEQRVDLLADPARSDASSEEKGSSSSSAGGRSASALASATRCCSPPESSCGRRRARGAMPTISSRRGTASPRRSRREAGRSRRCPRRTGGGTARPPGARSRCRASPARRSWLRRRGAFPRARLCRVRPARSPRSRAAASSCRSPTGRGPR